MENSEDILHYVIYIITIIGFIVALYFSHKKYKDSKEDYKKNEQWIFILFILVFGMLYLIFN